MFFCIESFSEFGKIAKDGRWSEIDKVKLPDMIFGLKKLVKILSMRVSAIELILVGKRIIGNKKFVDSIS